MSDRMPMPESPTDEAERLRFALEAAEIGVWELDLVRQVVRFSRRAAEIVGVQADVELDHHALREMLSPEDRDRAAKVMAESHQHGGVYVIDYRVNRADGKQIWVTARGRSRADAAGNVTMFTGTLQDITAQKKTEADLLSVANSYHRQLRLFEQISSTTLDFIYVLDLQGRFVYANRQLLEVWGVSFDDAVGKSLEQLGYPDWHVRMHMREIREVIATKQPIKGEVPFTGGSGISGIYEYIFTPVLDEEDEVELIAGTTRDVTERDRSERATEEARAVAEANLARWQTVIDNMAEGVTVADAQGNLLDMNQAALDMHGFENVAEVQKNVHLFADDFTIYDPNGRPLPVEQWPLSRLTRGERFSNLEAHVTRKSNNLDKIISYSGAPILDQNGNITLVLLTLHDITAERNAQRSLRESEARLRELFEQTPFGMALNDINGRYLHVNPAYCQIVGRSREDLLSTDAVFQELILTEDLPMAVEKQRQLIAGEIPAFFLEKRYVRPDGSSVWVRVTATLRRDAFNRPVQFVKLVEDIDDRKRAEAELAHLLDSERAARNEAERAGRIKDEFLATLSHELRTPLNAILGWSQMMGASRIDNEEIAEGLSIIERNARAQKQIIEDLLDMSRIISGKIHFEMQRLDLVSIARTAVGTIRPAAEAKGVTLAVQIDSNVGPISGDPSRMQQVLWNLLTNAVKFTPRNGRVSLSLRPLNGQLELIISDSGEGISPDFLPYVFDRFRQSDASTTRRHGGLGLGLAIVKQLVDLHGGTIRADSTGIGEGSTFIVMLPVLAPKIAEIGRPDSGYASERPAPLLTREQRTDLTGLRVLVVDDEADARALTSRLLNECNAEVMTADCAEEAVSMLNAERPDVIVSDIGMPIEDGYSLMRRIRALPPEDGGSTPAVALTAYARAEDRVKAVLAGYQHHVAKPVDPTELIAMVASLAPMR